jgi:hypothetical protein
MAMQHHPFDAAGEPLVQLMQQGGIVGKQGVNVFLVGMGHARPKITAFLYLMQEKGRKRVHFKISHRPEPTAPIP